MKKMKALRMPPMYKCIGLVDADLLDNGTRHPNLALLKIAGFLYDNYIPFELILDSEIDLERYDHIYLSKVFTFTKLPKFYTEAIGTINERKFHIGGTGFYATTESIKEFTAFRKNDILKLDRDEYLSKLTNYRGGNNELGINMARQMPYYHLYDAYVEQQVRKGFKREKYKDYLKYSIGFLTRGCIRHCPFCINKLENTIIPHLVCNGF